MPRHRYRTLINTMLRKAVVETLEQRTLFDTIITDSDPGTAIPNDAILEYKDHTGGLTRIHVHGDVSAEFVFAVVPTGSGTAILGDHIPVAAPGDGADLYHVYVAEATVDSYIAISRYVVTPSGNPMTPFTGAPTIRVNNAQPVPPITVAPGTGAIYLGARTRTVNTALTPILFASFDGLGIMPPTDNGNLVPGLTVLNRQDLGGFLFAGAISGVVSIDASIDTFYAGALVTGETQGVPEGFSSAVPNFGVSGDMRNLFVMGPVGTNSGANRDAPQYISAFKAEIRGSVNQIKTETGGAEGSIYGEFQIDHHPNASKLFLKQREIEDRTPRSGGASLFEEGILGGNANFFNDSFANPQYLGVFNSRTLGNNVMQIYGKVQTNPNIDDYVDYYGVPMLAGQTITVRQISTQAGVVVGGTPVSTSIVNVGIFDPDGRLVATDYSKKDSLAIVGQPFQFTADRPGVYRLAVSPTGVADFAGPPTVLTTYPYQLQVLGAGDLALGAIAASGHIFDPNMPDQVLVERGDLGAVAARIGISSESATIGNVVNAVSQVTVLHGSLRDLDAPSIGFTTGASATAGGNGEDAVPIAVAGDVGLIRSSGTSLADTLLIRMGGISVTGFGLPAGRNLQMVDSATSLNGPIAANAAIGIIRAADMNYTPGREIMANADGIGSDGIIDLIDVTGQFGTLDGGGARISTGQGGNLRYFHVGGTVFIDRTFGGGSTAVTSFQQGESATFNDDSGAQIVLTPTIDRVRDPLTGVITENSGTLSVTAYPIFGSGGVALINVTSTRGVTAQGTALFTNSSVEIGTIEAQGTGARVVVDPGRDLILGSPTSPSIDNPRGPDKIPYSGDEPLVLDPTSTDDNSVILVGDTEVDVLEVRGRTVTPLVNNFNQIRNRTPNGEIPIVTVSGSIGRLESTRLGFGKPLRTGGALLPRVTINHGDTFPFLQQKTGVVTTWSTDVFNARIAAIYATQGIGNIFSEGTIQTINPNSDGRFVSKVFEGIVGPIVADAPDPTAPLAEIREINIGEGIAAAGNGNLSRAGVFADGRIYDIANQGVGSDIRGDIVSRVGINNIILHNGSFINADVLVVLDYTNARELGALLTLPTSTGSITNPVYAIDNIVTTGVGGMIGTFVAGNDINNMDLGGFGFINSSVDTGPIGRLNSIRADGYGLRDAALSGGSTFGRVEALGRGKRVSTLVWTPAVRFSEVLKFDPYSGQPTGTLTDLHSFLGTSKKSPRRKGFSNTGTIDELDLRFQLNGDLIRGQTLKNSLISVGNKVDTVGIRDYVDTLEFTTGGVNNFITGTDVFRSLLTIAGPVGRVGIGGTWKGTSTLNAIGPNGTIDLFATGRALFGQVIGTVKVGTVQVGTDLGSPKVYSGGNMAALIVDGNILPGAAVTVKKDLGLLAVGGNIEDNATITADRIIKRQIGGTIFGDIIIV